MNDTELALIPTETRDRLPAGLSYPVNASAVSAALHDVPQFSALRLCFSAGPTSFASEFRRRLARTLPVPAVRLAYSKRPPGISGGRHVPPDSALYPEHWDLTVFGVPRPHKRSIGVELVADGLPALRAWLLATRSDTWRAGLRLFAVFYTLPQAGITTREACGPNAYRDILA